MEAPSKVEPETVFHNDPFLDSVARYFIGNNNRYRENIIIPRSMGPVYIKSNEEKMIEAGFESCAFKTLMSCVAGFGLGGALGLFSSSLNPTIVPGQELKTQTAREILREMKGTMLSYAKNFAMVGAMFSAVECVIETVLIPAVKPVISDLTWRPGWPDNLKSGYDSDIRDYAIFLTMRHVNEFLRNFNLKPITLQTQ